MNPRSAPPERTILPAGTAIRQGRDGVLRWVYELSMWRNPTLMITLAKVLLLSMLFPALLMFFIQMFEGAELGATVWLTAKIGGLVLLILGGLLVLAYALIAWIYGGKYCVVFEMDPKGVRHLQMKSQFAKSRLLSLITVLAGGASGNLQVTGAGLLAGARQSLYSRFSRVRKVVVCEQRSVIYVIEGLHHNQVYAGNNDFAFVRDYIIAHAPGARVSYK